MPVDPAWLVTALSALVATRQVPGAQLAIHRAGATVAVEVGELEHRTGTPVTRETAFPIGSVSKVWAATLTMILIADGDLELDAPLDIHLPELGDLGSKLTLGQLLSHTSGFACSPDMHEQSALSLGRYVREHCRAQDLIFPPGTGFSYSNRNYVVVGRLIEAITGMSCSEAMESILLRPLGIDPAAVVGSIQAPFGRHIATGHSVNIAVGRTRPVQQSLMLAEAPAAALAMSAVNLVALGLMHIGPGFPELLPAAYAELMRQAVPEADPFGLADGWGSGLALFRGATTDWIGHDGNANGTSCYLRIDPAGGCVVALTTNANTGSYLWDVDHLPAFPAHFRCPAQIVPTAPATPRLMCDHLVGNRDRRQRRPRTPGLPAGLRPLRLRSDFGASLANPSELGGFEAFFEVYPSRVSNSAIRTRAAPSSADNASISSSRCENRSSNSTTNGVSSTARSSTPRTTRSTNHADHQDLTIYGTKVGPYMAATGQVIDIYDRR